MNDINQFPFYKNYYELLDNLPTEDKRLMLESIVDFMFKDKEPDGLKKMNLAIWNNIKLPLYSVKKNILNGKKGGRPKKEENPTNNPKQNPINNPIDNPKRNQNNIFNFYLLISNFIYLEDKEELRNIIKEWLEYKWERKEYYKEKGFNSLLKQIEKATKEYGEEKVIDLINECMANNYKGIIFEKLEKSKIKKQVNTTEWLNEDIKEDKATKEEIERFKKTIGGVI